MTIKESKELFERAILSATRSSSSSCPSIRPGYINFGSHLNQKNSLSAKVKIEINQRCFSKQDV